MLLGLPFRVTQAFSGDNAERVGTLSESILPILGKNGTLKQTDKLGFPVFWSPGNEIVKPGGSSYQENMRKHYEKYEDDKRRDHTRGQLFIVIKYFHAQLFI